MCFNSHILNFLAADYFFNVDTQQLMVFIFHSQAQEITSTGCMPSPTSMHLLLFYYSTFVRIFQVKFQLSAIPSFGIIQRKAEVAYAEISLSCFRSR